MELSRAYVPGLMASGMSCNLQRALSRGSDGVRRRSRACFLASVANSEGVHVYNAFGFDLVHINVEDKFFGRNCQGIDMT